MTDRQTEAILRCIHGFLEGVEGEAVDVGKSISFERMIDYVRNCLPDINQVENDELRTIIAMCWLGPRAGIPPQPLRKELLEIIRDRVPEADERCGRTIEFVIAYGCGKFRRIFNDGDEWYRRWPGAMQALQRSLESSVRKADRWLRLQLRVAGYPEKENVDLSREAWLLALTLIHPEAPLHLAESDLKIECTDDGVELLICDATVTTTRLDSAPNGTSLVLTVLKGATTLSIEETGQFRLAPESTVIIAARNDEAKITAELNGDQARARARIRFWESGTVSSPTELSLRRCTCGNDRCVSRHRLDGWDPDESRLWSFAASAVTGPQQSMEVGSFIAGMYFAILSKGKCGRRLRLGSLEYKICHHCSTFNLTREAPAAPEGRNGSLETSKERSTEFEGLCCPNCRTLFDPSRSPRGTHERFIMTDFVPRYRPSLRIRCKNRKAHYRITAGSAPPTTLTDRWENLFTLPNSWSLENVRNARRAIADDNYLRILIADPPTYLTTPMENGIIDEKELKRRLKRRLKEWLKAPLDAACPLCGEQQARQLNVVWERTFAAVKPIGSPARGQQRQEGQVARYAQPWVGSAQAVDESGLQSYD